MSYQPVTTKTDLATLDDEQVLAGYLSVLAGNYSSPGSDKTRSFWHGWRNGMADCGKIPIDSAMRSLASDMHDECVGTLALIELVLALPQTH